jgi:glycosyltransferase involved in cell wall biosynthesis
MRIGIDARCLEEKDISGIGEYAMELIKNLLLIDNINSYTIFSNSFKAENSRLNYFQEFENITLRRLRYPNKILNFLIWYFGYPKLDQLMGEVDILFAPNINFISVSKRCSLVLTFHDLSFERLPQFYLGKRRLWHKYFVAPRKLARLASKIIAISDSTKKDLIDLYNIPENNIKVVYHGVGKEYCKIRKNDPKLLKIKKKYNLPDKFLLYLGTIEPRKNIDSLIKAYREFRKNNPSLEAYKLILVGGANFLKSRQLESIKKGAYGQDIYLTGYIPKEEKPYFFNLASLSIYPSFFEGFGLPLLESMACGTPVITSHSSSMPEVVSDAAVLVNPMKAAELSGALASLLESRALYDKFRGKGLMRSSLFSWENCAEQTLEIITATKK